LSALKKELHNKVLHITPTLRLGIPKNDSACTLNGAHRDAATGGARAAFVIYFFEEYRIAHRANSFK
jgi:hypothetical protein